MSNIQAEHCFGERDEHRKQFHRKEDFQRTFR